MVSGLDTTFMVQFEVREHPNHSAARKLLTRWVQEGHLLAIAPQVLAEFIHIVTDPKRFERPLTVAEATARAQLWWDSREMRQTFPNAGSLAIFFEWMTRLNLGRKRILDTMLAATYLADGIQSIITSNVRDFKIYNSFEVIIPELP